MSAQINARIAQLRVAAVEAQKEAEEAIVAFGEEAAALFIEQAQGAQELLDIAIADAAEMEAAIEAQQKQFDAEREIESPIAVAMAKAKGKGRQAKRQAKFQKPAPKAVDPIERLDPVGQMLELRSRRNQKALQEAYLAGPTPVQLMIARREAEKAVVSLPKEPTLASELEHEPVTREGIELRAFNARRVEQEARNAQRRLERQGKQVLRQLDAPVSFSTQTGEAEGPRFENAFERQQRLAEGARKAKEIKQQQARISAVKTVDAKWAAL